VKPTLLRENTAAGWAEFATWCLGKRMTFLMEDWLLPTMGPAVADVVRQYIGGDGSWQL
jgi:hypothetical protein